MLTLFQYTGYLVDSLVKLLAPKQIKSQVTVVALVALLTLYLQIFAQFDSMSRTLQFMSTTNCSNVTLLNSLKNNTLLALCAPSVRLRHNVVTSKSKLATSENNPIINTIETSDLALLSRKIFISRDSAPTMNASGKAKPSFSFSGLQQQYDICFISSAFASSVKDTDRVYNASIWLSANISNVKTQFLFFTNLPQIQASGWTKIVLTSANLPYRRFITQSRYGKFMAWENENIRNSCRVIIYMDAFIQPRLESIQLFLYYVQKVRWSQHGFIQVRHTNSLEEELEAIRHKRKDLRINQAKLLQWLRAQPDFSWSCALYQNAVFMYSPKSYYFQKAASFFWDHYSMEKDLWRDQPLWGYTLHHFNITPGDIPWKMQSYLFDFDSEWRGHSNHRYTAAADNNTLIQKI